MRPFRFLWFGFFPVLLLPAMLARGATMSIDSLSGPVTANEINSFISFMNAQTPPVTPWGAVNGTTGDHNEWADGTGGRELEAMGELFEVSSNMTILNKMISWSDYCTSQRNDLMAATNGGQRVMWTGLIDKLWCPNEPTDAHAQYAGCENEDVEGHLAYCAKLILKTPAIWNLTVPDGNPYGYGATYFQRATNYLAKCDEANDEYSLKWFINPSSSVIIAPTQSAWTVFSENVNANNRQMMFMSGFQRLAEAHELLGDNPARVTQYDNIVRTNVTICLNGMVKFPGNPLTANGQTVYKWGYYPTSTTGIETTEIHAEYDIIGLWRAFTRAKYGFTLAPLIPFGNTMVNVTYLGTNKFAVNVDGTGGIQSPVFSGWILPADWNPQVYTCVAGSAYTNNWYTGRADVDAGILFMKNRRYLQFSVTPSPATQVVQAGAQANYTLAVAPLGGFTNTVTLAANNLPSGATAVFTNGTVNCGALALSSTNSTLAIKTTVATPAGAYAVSIISTGGGISHTNNVSLVVGNFSVAASPSSQTVSPGGNTSYTVTVATNSGFSGTIAFGLAGLPANCSASFSPASLSGAGSSALNVIASNTATAGSYTLTIYGTNGATIASATATLQIAGTATPVWNGGSGTGNYWNDANNWGGILPSANGPLVFGGGSRLVNTNNTAAGTTYSNLTFNPGAGTFALNGNPVSLAGNITNNSANPQTIDFGINFGGAVTFTGAGNDLFVLGGLTNTLAAPLMNTLTLEGTGQLSDEWAGGGTNILLMNDANADWIVVHNPNSTATPVPWVLEINNGTFEFGSDASAPVITTTTGHNSPSDNVLGNVSGAVAEFDFVNGTFTTGARLNTAQALNSTAIVNVTGGTLNLADQFQGANGQNTEENSQVNVSGGAMNVGTGSTGPFYVASRGTGYLAVSENGVVSCGTLDVSRNASGNTFSSAGEVDLDGGTLMVTGVTNISANAQTGGAPTAAFHFNGGTLMAKSGAKTLFFQGCRTTPVCPITAIVEAGGAVIDDGGNSITIGEPLQHDGTLGIVPDGGLTKLDTGTLNLTTTNSYTGETLVAGGTLALNSGAAIINSAAISISPGATLDASVHNGGALTIVNGQTLTGGGTVKGNITIAGGATLAPGGSLDTLVFNNNLTLAGGSTTLMEVSDTPTTNDAAQVAGSLVLSGSLVITNAGTNSLSAGDSFKLFNATIFSGAFTNLSPVIPGINLAWNTNNLTNGVLGIVSSPTPPPKIATVNLSGGNFIIGGSNGVPNWPYSVLASTDLALPVAQWTVIASNSFDAAGGFIFTNTTAANTPQTFYRLELQ
jgi:autotransporter-associated beta strand protein